MDLDVVFAGTGGSVPSARRGLPALLLRRGGERLLFDCGEGTQRQLLRSVGLPDIDAVFVTHHHADHWLGLPGMLKSFDLRDRQAPLDVFGPPGTARLLESLRGVFGRTAYPLTLTDLGAGDALEFDGYEVQAFNVRHRGTAFGYAIVEHERPGRFDAELARSLGVEEGPDFGRLQHGESVGGVSPEQVVGPARAGRRIVISGDTAPCDMVRAAAQGADLLVHEATFTERGGRSRAGDRPQHCRAGRGDRTRGAGADARRDACLEPLRGERDQGRGRRDLRARGRPARLRCRSNCRCRRRASPAWFHGTALLGSAPQTSHPFNPVP